MFGFLAQVLDDLAREGAGKRRFASWASSATISSPTSVCAESNCPQSPWIWRMKRNATAMRAPALQPELQPCG